MDKPKINIKLFDEEFECYLTIANYVNNDRLYLGLETKDELFDDITINLPGYLLDDNEIFVNADMSKEIKKQLEKFGILSKHISTDHYNMGSYDRYEVDFDKLKYYDPDGYDKYIKHIGIDNLQI